MKKLLSRLQFTSRQSLRSESGVITVDFLFAFALVWGFTMLFFALSLTLSVVEITQYITFASARNVYAANYDNGLQGAQGEAKYNELLAHPVFNPLYNNGWFEVVVPPIIGPVNELQPNYDQPPGSPNTFFGVATRFTARMLDLKVPFFGSTAPDSDGTGSGFTTFIGSYLGREPNTVQCMDFNSKKWKAIRKLNVTGGAPYSSFTSDDGYFLISDNGC